MPTNSSLDLQRFYPDELEIVSIEEDSDEIRLHMLSRSKSFCCPKCGEERKRQIIMRSDAKLPQPFASWSNSL